MLTSLGGNGGGGSIFCTSSLKQKSRFAGAQSRNDDANQDEMNEFSSYAPEKSEMGRLTKEKANRANSSNPSVWCSDSGATSMSCHLAIGRSLRSWTGKAAEP